MNSTTTMATDTITTETKMKYQPLDKKFNQWKGPLAIGESETRKDGAMVTLLSVYPWRDGFACNYRVNNAPDGSYEGSNRVKPTK